MSDSTNSAAAALEGVKSSSSTTSAPDAQSSSPVPAEPLSTSEHKDNGKEEKEEKEDEPEDEKQPEEEKEGTPTRRGGLRRTQNAIDLNNPKPISFEAAVNQASKESALHRAHYAARGAAAEMLNAGDGDGGFDAVDDFDEMMGEALGPILAEVRQAAGRAARNAVTALRLQRLVMEPITNAVDKGHAPEERTIEQVVRAAAGALVQQGVIPAENFDEVVAATCAMVRQARRA